ncbi:MAG: pyridoxamine 5'-phosphate oxidase family protein [Desulfobacteraceae bacterium]|nr:pyridoxamine 5'-phosphate oxidase family protein [Desulfobacteraceae bacterium]
MEIEKDWNLIKRLFDEGIKSSRFYAIASTNPDGSPHICPIGSLILYGPGHGVYADEFPVQLSRNIAGNPRVCVMAVNNGQVFWLKSLIQGKFSKYPGIRLFGVAGEKRPGTDREIDNWMKRVKVFRRFKGYDLLWRHIKHVRDIRFDGVRVISAGKMSRGLST